MQNYLWGIRNIEEVTDEAKKMVLQKILLVCQQIIFQLFIEKFDFK